MTPSLTRNKFYIRIDISRSRSGHFPAYLHAIESTSRRHDRLRHLYEELAIAFA